MISSRALRRCVLPVGAVGVAWATDEFYGYRVAQRTLRALGTGGILLWAYKVQWTPETSEAVHARVSRQLVDCLKKNEGLYVKFGQGMATMDVVLPEEYKKELMTLHDQAATFSFSEVRRVVEAELGQKLEDVFSEFEPYPIASASIAQVHRATLRNTAGRPGSKAEQPDAVTVAVKVQKPNIPTQNGCDLAVYKLLLHVLEYAFDLPLSWTYDYTCQQLEAELDFRIEAQNAQRAAVELDACPHLRGKVVVPRVHTAISGRRVMVMEWVDSIGPVSDGAALKKAGLNEKEIMQTATEVFGYQIFSTGHVHCDPHPGNLLVRVLPGGNAPKWQLVLLDHGLYCNLSSHLRQEYADFWVAATLGDGSAAAQICRKWGLADQDATELLASLTQFRRVRFGAERLGSVAGLFGRKGPRAQRAPEKHRKLTPEELAAAQVRLKARAKKVLADTKSFPQELFFVGRNLNIIRSANFALGSAVNRIAILAECAAAGSVNGGSLATMDRLTRRIALAKFHMRVQSLLFADYVMRTLKAASDLWIRSCEYLDKVRCIAVAADAE
eukprot:TRINITY_DN94633_c0_g1_i1.p1 TRINITY_DN94633_c0_g1~~TRINITY_DN94633_c0_g1_i1.p1  ORF type:complete len:556 (+),score=80.07 TRINITY_DN94633_c0_g1_i1:28-1695(+)